MLTVEINYSMLKKLTNCMSSLLASKKNKDSEVLNKDKMELNTDIEIQIEWDDIVNGLPSSETNSIVANSLRRHGYEGMTTPCKVVLNNGDIYVPEQLSDHWEAFIGSPKIKPKLIKYINVTNA